MISTTRRVRKFSLPAFDDPTKRIDLFQLEQHLARSRRTAIMAAIACGPDDDDDTRATTPRRAIALAPEPPVVPRPAVYPVKQRDPASLVIIVVVLSALAAVMSVILY